jgi:hypothetical protein
MFPKRVWLVGSGALTGARYATTAGVITVDHAHPFDDIISAQLVHVDAATQRVPVEVEVQLPLDD